MEFWEEFILSPVARSLGSAESSIGGVWGSSPAAKRLSRSLSAPDNYLFNMDSFYEKKTVRVIKMFGSQQGGHRPIPL